MAIFAIAHHLMHTRAHQLKHLHPTAAAYTALSGCVLATSALWYAQRPVDNHWQDQRHQEILYGFYMAAASFPVALSHASQLVGCFTCELTPECAEVNSHVMAMLLPSAAMIVGVLHKPTAGESHATIAPNKHRHPLNLFVCPDAICKVDGIMQSSSGDAGGALLLGLQALVMPHLPAVYIGGNNDTGVLREIRWTAAIVMAAPTCMQLLRMPSGRAQVRPTH